MPLGQKKKQKAKNRSNIVTNLIKTLKMVHIKKIFKKERKDACKNPQPARCQVIRNCCLAAKECLTTLLRPHGLQPTSLLCPWDSPGKNTGVDCHFLLQGIFLTQGSNPCLLHLVGEFSAEPPGKTTPEITAFKCWQRRTDLIWQH